LISGGCSCGMVGPRHPPKPRTMMAESRGEMRMERHNEQTYL
jgi:hypothetical protein